MIAGKRYKPVKADIWSCGVILYAMVCGTLPFEDKKTKTLYKKILSGEFKIPTYLSLEIRELLRGILNTNPETRFTIDQIREHAWSRRASVVSPSGIIISQHKIPIDFDIVT
jgi:5'-AMP-activated protein kinase catalytic alpha subunit